MTVVCVSACFQASGTFVVNEVSIQKLIKILRMPV